MLFFRLAFVVVVCFQFLPLNSYAQSKEDLLKSFYVTLGPTALHNGTTLDDIVENTSCESMPESLTINDPDGNYVFEAQKAYCRLVENGIEVSKDNKDLKGVLIAAQLGRIKHIIDLHTGGVYAGDSMNPTAHQWKSVILGVLDESSFGAAGIEVTKVIKARDELKTLGVKSLAILAYLRQ